MGKKASIIVARFVDFSLILWQLRRLCIQKTNLVKEFLSIIQSKIVNPFSSNLGSNQSGSTLTSITFSHIVMRKKKIFGKRVFIIIVGFVGLRFSLWQFRNKGFPKKIGFEIPVGYLMKFAIVYKKMTFSIKNSKYE